MNRVAIVVQRYHPELAGGSEQHAGLYARYLAEAGMAVDLITTTARDAVNWANEYPPGIEEHDGFRVLRFPVAGGRTADWQALHALLLREATAVRSEACSADFFGDSSPDYPPKLRWPRALQEEWIRRQGPDSPQLVAHLAANGDTYACVIFLTYLFAPTYFGSSKISRPSCLLVPTLHDEAPAYLPAFERAARGVGGILWNTVAEEQLGRALWGPFSEDIRHSRGGMGIDIPVADPRLVDQSRELAQRVSPAEGFALYCGRISAAKGCREMIDWFLAARSELEGELPEQARGDAAGSVTSFPGKLVLTGDLQMDLPKDPAIVYAGFVSEELKFALMSAARVFVMPSEFESLSVVTLEAMGQGTPVLGNGRSPVVQDHILQSGAGRLYEDRAGFMAALRELCFAGSEERLAMSAGARAYVAENYSHKRVSERVVGAVRAMMS